jgi:hypothetical protein
VEVVAIDYFACNFIKIHRTLRVSPAMAAGVTTRLFDVMICRPVDRIGVCQSHVTASSSVSSGDASAKNGCTHVPDDHTR